jgi:proline racemase
MTPGSQLGVLYMMPEGYSRGMCGHGTIGLCTALVELGMIPGALPLHLTLDSAVGPVAVRVDGHDGIVDSVTFRNVPSFVYHTDVILSVPTIGDVRVDVAFGGDSYAYVRASDIDTEVRPEQIPELQKKGVAILEAARAQIKLSSPDPSIVPRISQVMVRDRPGNPEAQQKNIVVGEVKFDRSPCGTGTCGWLAVVHAKGELALGQGFVHESVMGGIFRGRLVEETSIGNKRAVVPEITGSAYITAFHDFVIDPNDPYKYGLTVSAQGALSDAQALS